MEQVLIQSNLASVNGFLDTLSVQPSVQIKQGRFFTDFLHRAAQIRSQAIDESTLCITTWFELTKTSDDCVRFPKLVAELTSLGMRVCTDSECLALYTQTGVLLQHPTLLCIMDPVIVPFDYNGPNLVDTPFCLMHYPSKHNTGHTEIGLGKVDGSMIYGIPTNTRICVARA